MGDELRLACGMFGIRVNVPGYCERSVLGFGLGLGLSLMLMLGLVLGFWVVVLVRVRD